MAAYYNYNDAYVAAWFTRQGLATGRHRQPTRWGIMRRHDGVNERGFWTCHATFEAVGSTGLAALLRHMNYLSHQSDTQRDDGRSAETKSEALARALCCSTKTIQRLVRLGRALEVLTTRQLQHSQVFTVEYDHLAQLIGRCGLATPKWMLTPGPRRSRAGTQLSFDVEAEIAGATQRAEEPQATAPASEQSVLPPPGAEQKCTARASVFSDYGIPMREVRGKCTASIRCRCPLSVVL